MKTNKATENPTLYVNAFTVRLLWPLSFIKKNSAEPKLVSININAIATRIFISVNGERNALFK